MSARPLSVRERQAISDILSEAELEFCSPRDPPPPVKSVHTIDQQCKQLWPDWDPVVASTRQNGSPPPTPPESTPLRARDVDSLKAEVQRLMTRITSVANGQALSPATQAFMDRVRMVAQVPPDASEVELLEPDRAPEEKPKPTPPGEGTATERELKRVTRENRDLRKQLTAAQKAFEDSQAEVAALRRALEKMSTRKEAPPQRASRARR
jgi:hypothetical protein